jgi:hypothetical protein
LKFPTRRLTLSTAVRIRSPFESTPPTNDITVKQAVDYILAQPDGKNTIPMLHE